MPKPASPFADLPTWKRLRPPARKAAAAALYAALGKDWEPMPDLAGALGLAQVRHRASGLAFVAVPGGAYRAGLTPADRKALGKVAWDEDWIEESVNDAFDHTPPRAVKVKPFLLARFGFGGKKPPFVVPAKEAARLAKRGAAWGLRLPTEAEWEWVARGGGATAFVDAPSRKAADAVLKTYYPAVVQRRELDPEPENAFGVSGMPVGDWVQGGRSRGGAALGWPFQLNLGLLLMLAGFRPEQGGPAAVRFARDLPGA